MKPAIAVAVVGLALVIGYLISPYFTRSTLIESAPAGGVKIASGSFNEIDVIHKGRGTATIFRLADGRLRVQLDDFSVTNGPDLHVFLSRHAAPGGWEHATDGVLLGMLKAPEGAFSYETTSPVDAAQVRSVVIHCVRFRTLFSFATLGT